MRLAMTPDFGRRLRTVRRARGLSQEQLAADAGLHRTHISLIERALREPSLDTLVAICRVLEVTPSEAITWHVPRGREPKRRKL